MLQLRLSHDERLEVQRTGIGPPLSVTIVTTGSTAPGTSSIGQTSASGYPNKNTPYSVVRVSNLVLLVDDLPGQGIDHLVLYDVGRINHGHLFTDQTELTHH